MTIDVALTGEDWQTDNARLPTGAIGIDGQGKGGVRQFETGATRDVEAGKPDYEAFLSPLVIEAYGQYMNACRDTAAGRRPGDNWQLGIALPAYMKSGWRHFFDWWKGHRAHDPEVELVIPLLAVIFNASGYLHELLKKYPRQISLAGVVPGILEAAIKQFEKERAEEIAARLAAQAQQPPAA